MVWLYELLHVMRTLVPLLIVPPSSLILLALVGLVTARRWPLFGTGCAAFGVVGLFLLSMPIVSRVLIHGLEAAQPEPEGQPAPAAIVILGGDAHRVENVPGKTQTGLLSLQRVVGAADLVRRTGLPVLITGGVVGLDEPPVADLMADTLAGGFRIPVMWREERSSTTCENARFSAVILRQAGIPAAWVVTHSWHMKRALLSFARAGYPVRAAPLPADAVEVRGVSDFLPHVDAWTRSYYALHEWIGLVAYHLGACPVAPGDGTPVIER